MTPEKVHVSLVVNGIVVAEQETTSYVVLATTPVYIRLDSVHLFGYRQDQFTERDHVVVKLAKLEA